MKNVELVYTAQKFLKNHKVHLRDLVGSIEGPRLVLEPMEVRSCVPRVPWNVFGCLEYKIITNAADFRVDDDCPPPQRYKVLKICRVNWG